MNALVILVVSIVVLCLGYLFYGRWLAKEWGVDVTRETPAHTMADGVDYCAAKAPVVLGHHFASIAGAGPISGPIAAAIFGWLPVMCWILIGGIFFGATHDFAALFASVRHEGKSIGHIIEMNIGRRGKRLFLVFAYLTLLLVVAAFGSIVVGTFASGSGDALNLANGRTASISMLFIVLAVAFGFFVYRRNAPLGISTVVGVIGLILCIVIGYNAPIHMTSTFWMGFVMVYILVASVTPVWILLQPRDYLNSFLLYGMLILAVVGVVAAHPTMALPAFTGWTGINNTSSTTLFPYLFITVACGAISGFHSLVGSGTTSKQLDNEKDCMNIGYGGMLIECVLATISVICVGILFTAEGGMPTEAATAVFAKGVAVMLETVGLPYEVMYSVLILAVSAFCLTSLDTATRLARYMFQEFFMDEGQTLEDLTGIKKTLANPYVATAITVALGGSLMGDYTLIWPLFGASNQLLAALALLACASWLGNIGKNNKMFMFPMCFMLIATLTSLVTSTFIPQLTSLMAGFTLAAALQVFFSAALVILAVILAIEGFQTLSKQAAKK
ncbi:carbon starvation protein A [Bengtsoniella intestinalis]|uniref:carbon starvation CstA family protein n=1 Tax=Bengtsoniella intestinalis TaxID=3073143 RepID=UPI00391F7C78